MDPRCVSLVSGTGRSDGLRAQGLVVNGRQYRITVLSPDDISLPSDLLIVAVKHHHLSEAIEDMKHRIGEKTYYHVSHERGGQRGTARRSLRDG